MSRRQTSGVGTWQQSDAKTRWTAPLVVARTEDGHRVTPAYPTPARRRGSTLAVSRRSVNELRRGRRAVSPTMALCLSRRFGNAPELWLGAQRAVNLWDAAQAIQAEVERIKPLRVA